MTSTNGNGHNRRRTVLVPFLIGLSLFLAGGSFTYAIVSNNNDAAELALVACRQDNEDFRFRVAEYERQIDVAEDVVDRYRARDPFLPSTIPGFSDLDPETQAYLGVLAERSVAAVDTDEQTATDAVRAIKNTLSLYTEQYAVDDCDGDGVRGDVDDFRTAPLRRFNVPPTVPDPLMPATTGPPDTTEPST